METSATSSSSPNRPKACSKTSATGSISNVWVQVTQIGLDAFVDHSEMVVWATALADGAPLQDLTVEADSGIRQAATGPDGVARFTIPTGGASYLVARQGEDVAMLPASTHLWDESGWSPRSAEDDLRWYVVDDRQMYRPGEEVHLKGWIRRIGGKQDGDVGLVGGILEEPQLPDLRSAGQRPGNRACGRQRPGRF